MPSTTRTWDLAARHDRQAHVDATDSAVGQRILADWDGPQGALKYFVKVMPRDFKRVLQAIAQAESTGEDVDKAIMAAANA